MSRAKILAVSAMATLLASSAFGGFYDVVADRFDPQSGTGLAVIHVEDDLYARVIYVDLDGDGLYSPGDERLTTTLFEKTRVTPKRAKLRRFIATARRG
jgi:hypothetical protein